jgi:hypothetical protein
MQTHHTNSLIQLQGNGLPLYLAIPAQELDGTTGADY